MSSDENTELSRQEKAEQIKSAVIRFHRDHLERIAKENQLAYTEGYPHLDSTGKGLGFLQSSLEFMGMEHITLKVHHSDSDIWCSILVMPEDKPGKEYKSDRVPVEQFNEVEAIEWLTTNIALAREDFENLSKHGSKFPLTKYKGRTE